MPKRSVFHKLPDGIRGQLNRRLRAAAYGDTIAVADWMTSRGYPIRKSQVSAYAVTLRELDQKTVDARCVASPEIRIREQELLVACLQIASQKGDSRTVLARAQRFVDWVSNQRLAEPSPLRPIRKKAA